MRLVDHPCPCPRAQGAALLSTRGEERPEPSVPRLMPTGSGRAGPVGRPANEPASRPRDPTLAHYYGIHSLAAPWAQVPQAVLYHTLQ